MTAGSSRRLVAGAIAMATIAGCGLSLTTALLAVRLDAAGYSAGAIGINTAAGASRLWLALRSCRSRRGGSGSRACWSWRSGSAGWRCWASR